MALIGLAVLGCFYCQTQSILKRKFPPIIRSPENKPTGTTLLNKFSILIECAERDAERSVRRAKSLGTIRIADQKNRGLLVCKRGLQTKMAAAWRSNLGKYVREIRIHLCQKSPSSQGTR